MGVVGGAGVEGGGGEGDEPLAAKAAVTDFAASILTTHDGEPPAQSPLQPEKLDPDAGVAVMVTLRFRRKAFEHVLPQSMPAGALVTVPTPSPALLTVSVLVTATTIDEKLAVTVLAAFMVTVQASVPLQAPPQPANADPSDGEAASVTVVPATKPFEQVAPQSIPAGALVTVPGPVPPLVTVSVLSSGMTTIGPKLADTLYDPNPTSRKHEVLVPAFAQAPPQPLNTASASGVAPSTAGPKKSPVQSPGQLMPGPATVPDPDTVTVIVPSVRALVVGTLTSAPTRSAAASADPRGLLRLLVDSDLVLMTASGSRATACQAHRPPRRFDRPRVRSAPVLGCTKGISAPRPRNIVLVR